MTKEQLLQVIVSSEDLNVAIVALVTYIRQQRSTLDANLQAVEGKVTTLIGSDTAKSVRTIANEELAAQLIPANAKEALDTLQEIAAWIQAHPDDASAMNSAITSLQTLVGTLPQNTTATTVVGYITAEIAALAQTIQDKNVDATGDTGAGALVSASASGNTVNVASTQKLRNAVAAAESAVQPDDLGFLGTTAAAQLVADAISGAEAPAEEPASGE